MRQLYNAREAYFEDNAELDFDPDAPNPGMGGGTGGMVISGTLKGLITQFYASHPADTLFNAPSVIGGHGQDGRVWFLSHLGAIRGGVAHNGTDIVPPSVMYSLIAPHRASLSEPRQDLQTALPRQKGNAQRGNFVFVYYGESSGGGVFVLYQHLSPDFHGRLVIRFLPVLLSVRRDGADCVTVRTAAQVSICTLKCTTVHSRSILRHI